MADVYSITKRKRKRYYFLYDSLIFWFYEQAKLQQEEQQRRRRRRRKIWTTDPSCSICYNVMLTTQCPMVTIENIKFQKIRRHLHFNTTDHHSSYLTLVYGIASSQCSSFAFFFFFSFFGAAAWSRNPTQRKI